MRTLLVSEVPPWAAFGGAMRVRSVSRALAELGPVDLVLIPHRGMQGPVPPETEFANVCGVPNQMDPERTRDKLAEELPEWALRTRYDLVWYNRERAWLAAKGFWSGLHSVVDIDDLEDVVLQRWLSMEKTRLGRPVNASKHSRILGEIDEWAALHRRVADEADVMVLSSENDFHRLGFMNAIVVPNTYDADGIDDRTRDKFGRPKILFQGHLVWPNNVDAAVWLVETIAPMIRARYAEFSVVLAGLPSTKVRALAAHESVEVTGAVEDMARMVRSADIVVAPLRVGGGTRIKIIQAFAHRVPVVSTTIGAEGLDAVSGLHIQIGDTAEDLADGCFRLLSDPAASKRQADAAYEFYSTRYRAKYAVTAVHRAARLATAS